MSNRNQSGQSGGNAGSNANAANAYRGSQQGKDRSELNSGPVSGTADRETAPLWPDQMLKAKSFTSAYAEPEKEPPRHSWLKVAATVALVAGLGWLPAQYFLKGGLANANSPSANAAAQAKVARLITEEKSTLARVLSDLRILQSAYANVQSQISTLPSLQDQRSLNNSLKSMRQALDTVQKRTRAAQKNQLAMIGGLNQRLNAIEKSRKQAARTFMDRLTKLEAAFQQSQELAAAQTRQLAKLQKQKSNISSVSRSSVKSGTNYVLREVYRGVALLEGRRGLVEAVPGTYLPGAGRVRSIKRRSGKWVVVTSRGIIDSQSY